MHIQKLTVKIVTIQPVAIALPALSECLQVSELLPGHEITPYWSGVLLVPLAAIDEEGSFRCDANVSVRPYGQEEFGTRAELKNLNSTSAVRRSLHAEIERQVKACDEGEPLIQSTRRWDDIAGVTVLMRTKENADDYRYLPDPDLLPVVIEDSCVAEVEAAIRFVRDTGGRAVICQPDDLAS